MNTHINNVQSLHAYTYMYKVVLSTSVLYNEVATTFVSAYSPPPPHVSISTLYFYTHEMTEGLLVQLYKVTGWLSGSLYPIPTVHYSSIESQLSLSCCNLHCFWQYIQMGVTNWMYIDPILYQPIRRTVHVQCMYCISTRIATSKKFAGIHQSYAVGYVDGAQNKLYCL